MDTIFSEEQINKLMTWKNVIQTPRLQEWKVIEDQAEEEIRKIIETSSFATGTNLTEENIDKLFHLMRAFCRNRALSNLLYRENSLEVFNQRLRELYVGAPSSFPQRVDNFFKLKKVGIQTLSQLLLAFDSTKYPLITSQTKDALELDAQQEQKALEIALKKFDIDIKDEQQQYLDLTLDYLADFVIFEQIKEIISVDKFTSVNNMIWYSTRSDKDGPEEALEEYTSLTLEKDLKEYLAKNPHVLEKGLKLVEKEYPTREVGNIDLLLSDAKGYDVVVELKRGKENDDVVGQISRYMGWVMKNRQKKTRGIIVVYEPDPKLDYAILPFGPSLKIMYYRVKFDISNEYTGDPHNS